MYKLNFTLPAPAVQEIHNVSRTVLYSWIKSGKLNAEKKGQPLTWYFDPVEVESLRLDRMERYTIILAQICESVEDYLARQ